MTTARWRDVEAELQRARGARRLLPWVAVTAVGGALLAAVAGATLKAALVVLVPGIALGLLVLAAAIPRCPACGESLLRRGERPGPASRPRPVEAERARRCPRCHAAFE